MNHAIRVRPVATSELRPPPSHPPRAAPWEADWPRGWTSPSKQQAPPGCWRERMRSLPLGYVELRPGRTGRKAGKRPDSDRPGLRPPEKEEAGLLWAPGPDADVPIRGPRRLSESEAVSRIRVGDAGPSESVRVRRGGCRARGRAAPPVAQVQGDSRPGPVGPGPSVRVRQWPSVRVRRTRAESVGPSPLVRVRRDGAAARAAAADARMERGRAAPSGAAAAAGPCRPSPAPHAFRPLQRGRAAPSTRRWSGRGLNGAGGDAVRVLRVLRVLRGRCAGSTERACSDRGAHGLTPARDGYASGSAPARLQEDAPKPV